MAHLTEQLVEDATSVQLVSAGYAWMRGTDLTDAGLTPEGGLIGSVLRDASPPLLLAGAVQVGRADLVNYFGEMSEES